MLKYRLFATMLSVAAATGPAWRIEAQPPTPPSSGKATVSSQEPEEPGSGWSGADEPVAGGEVGGQVPGAASGPQDGSPGDASGLYLSKTELTLGLSALIVAFTTFVFGATMTMVGLVSLAKYREVLKKLREKFAELEGARKKVGELDQDLDTKISKVRGELERQEKIAGENRRYFEAVRGELVQLFVGIVENVSYALGTARERELKSLINEAEACLSLFSPDASEVSQSLSRLEDLGSANSVSPLNTLVHDPSVDPETRLRAQRVLHVVITRLESRRALPPGSDADGEAQESAEDKAEEPSGEGT